MIPLLAFALAGAVRTQAASISQYVQDGLHDCSMEAVVVRADQPELKKINEDFGNSYRFPSTHVDFKEPFMLRLDAKVGDTSILYILNGTDQLMRIPKMRVNQHVDLNQKPGRRQTSMDFGVLTPSLFEGSFFQAKFIREDRATGDAVFDLTYVAEQKDTSRDRVWLDQTKKYITRREWYNQFGRQLATFYYDQPQQINGIWMPTQLSVKNVDGVVAGVTRYDAIKVNGGLPDSLFATR